ncbi:hypothetical protein GCM10010430_70210 [Kitasatospora cystarginea]|uniref:Uncharacterized protein n=1 Tax=Kitasatospora cystarginea TaxID=58350 RepID=A0ABP5RTH5_9ACTN
MGAGVGVRVGAADRKRVQLRQLRSGSVQGGDALGEEPLDFLPRQFLGQADERLGDLVGVATGLEVRADPFELLVVAVLRRGELPQFGLGHTELLGKSRRGFGEVAHADAVR